MIIFHGLSTVIRDENSVLTVGTFDGVHLGHRYIIDELTKRAKLAKRKSTLVTFYPHPKQVLNINNELKILTTLTEKLTILKSLQVERVIIINFDKNFSMMNSDFFIKNVLYKTIGFNEIILGYDHAFGKNRSGNVENIKKFALNNNCNVIELQKVTGNLDFNIKSSSIRDLLNAGDMAKARNALGDNYSLHATVIRGDGRGHLLNYPTANLLVYDTDKLIPANGVYAVVVKWNGLRFKGMMNIGFRPTFNGNTRALEVHIFNFNQKIYGQKINVGFVQKIRNEKKFHDVTALKNQLTNDKEIALSILQN